MSAIARGSHRFLRAVLAVAVAGGVGACADGERAAAAGDATDGAVGAAGETGETGAADVADVAEVASDPSAGLVFIPDPGLRIDNASNAKAGIDPSGKVYLYYEARPGGARLATADDGLTFDAGVHPTTFAYHPARIALGDGRWRRYILSPDTMTFGSAISTDGLAFTPEAGVRYAPQPDDHGSMGVYDTFCDAAGGVVLLYLGDLHGKNNVRRAVAANGLDFAFQAGNVLGDDDAGGGAQSFVDISSIALGGVGPVSGVGGGPRRLFAMKGGAAIYSFLADRDGTAFVPPGARLARTDFTEVTVSGLFDPTVVALPDGSFRMYVTAQIGSRQAIVSAHAR